MRLRHKRVGIGHTATQTLEDREARVPASGPLSGVFKDIKQRTQE